MNILTSSHLHKRSALTPLLISLNYNNYNNYSKNGHAFVIPKIKIIMTDIQLSENFKLSEFTRSETARRRKINNDAPESVIENLRNLCQNVVYYMKKNWSDSKKRVDRLDNLSTFIAFRLGASL